ncbi:MAG: type VI secretion system ATPase TssH, partial [Cellvibrionaceae bacterium]|nr:type VI secretion system ATPase TssH [Cellvibrionaceae bacterium]
MRLDRLTNQLQTALSDAQSLAVGRDHTQLEPVHLLAAMLQQQGSAVRPLLNQAGFDIAGLNQAIDKALGEMAQVNNPTGEVPPSSELVRLLNLADKTAQQQGDQFIASEAVLLAAWADGNNSLAKLLEAHGQRQALEQTVKAVRGNETVDNPEAEGNRQ